MANITFDNNTIQSVAVVDSDFTHHIETFIFRNSFDTSVANANDATFDRTGTVMLIAAQDTPGILAYTCSAKFDPTTAVQNLGTISVQADWAQFSPDGLRVIIGSVTAATALRQYDLPTAFDLNGATNLVTQSLTFTGRGGYIRPDGLQITLCVSNDVTTIDLLSPFDISGAIVENASFTVSGAVSLFGIDFKSNGLVGITIDNSNDEVREFQLKQPYDFTSTNITLVNTLVLDSAQFIMYGGNPRGISYAEDGSRFFFMSNNRVFSSDLGSIIAGNNFVGGLRVIEGVFLSRRGFGVSTGTQTLGQAALYACTDTTNPRTLTVFTDDIQAGSPENPWFFTVKDETGGAAANNVSVTTQAGELIDGSASDAVISVDFGGIRFYSDGTNLFTETGN